MSGVMPIIKSRYETGFKKFHSSKKKEDIRWQVSEKLQKIAGVSPATVSRVMNGTANVDEEKKQKSS